MGTPVLRIRLLGECDLRYGEAPLPPLESARAWSLLAYLLLHREAPQSRQRLAFLLWPDSTESQARTNLRHVLHNLRRALPAPDRFLEVTQQTLQWREDAPFWLDAAAFEDALSRGEGAAGEASLTALREAVEIYTGDLLEESYDEWIFPEREQLRQRYLQTLERLIDALEARELYAQAIPYAERLLRHDPLHEETYRLLMRLHDGRGDRARALRVYHVCAATLDRELGVEPSAPTREAYEALLPAERQPAGAGRERGRVTGPPLVGRASEWSRLTTLWRAVEKGGTRLVLVTGEPGIGKTRLIEEFNSWCVQRGAVTAEARSYAAEGALAYEPLAAWLRSPALKARLARLAPAHLTELSRLLPEILAEVPGLARPEPLPESDQRHRLFDAAAGAILSMGGPLLLAADDLQWWDRDSLQFLHFLLRVDPGARLLVAGTARLEETDQWHPVSDLRTGLRALERLTEIDLDRLSREETALLAERVAGRPLGEPDSDRLYHETEGNPLFVVEALRAGWRRGDADGRWASSRVQAAIESRLAQLSEPARELVGVAATIGREFTSEVLALASEADERTLVRGLDDLWRRRIVREQGADAYDFSHDKIREVAYAALSPALRRHHHLRAARALEMLSARDPGPVSGQIAGHYEAAGATSEAVKWYDRAAGAAQQLHASHEAIRLLGRALELLRTLPATPNRDAHELKLLTALPGPVAAAEGFASSRLAGIRERSHELAAALGVELAPPLLRSLALASLCDDDFEPAREIAMQLRARGERDGDDVLLVEAEYVLGISAFWSGELEAARRHFEAAVERYRPELRRVHLHQYGQDTRVVCLSRLGNTLWFLGFPEAAARARDEARALAEETGHPYSRSVALMFGLLLALEMGDVECVRESLSTLTVGSLKAEAGQIRTGSEAVAGYLNVLDGRKEAGMARIQRALDHSLQSQDAPGARAFLVRLLLEACVAAGDARTGLAAADWALEAGGVRLWEAEVRRLRAGFLAAAGAPSQEVEAELGRALDVARRQGARMLELRTLTSILRHRIEHGDASAMAEAGSRLSAIVEDLTEARDTPDTRDAAALLNGIGDAARTSLPNAPRNA
jgi:DNA-binding SARP family transcriptional activator